MRNEKDEGFKRVEIGGRIRRQREKKMMTREELAYRIDITPRFLADIEAGIKGMSIGTLCRLSSELDISLDHIINGGDADPPAKNPQIKDVQAMMDLLFAGLDKCGFRCVEDMYYYTPDAGTGGEQRGGSRDQNGKK